ncbi:MAG: hypothetical protein HOW73_48215 [Polyangiaceae bacterium]|nr:hypothetical protein [Polyangiaceae bacterium]
MRPVDRAVRALVVAVCALAVLVAAPALARAQFGSGDLSPADDDTAAAKELKMEDGPTDEVVFLRAMADKPTVYVGEQVTVSVYLYFRVKYEMSERHDPKYSDFLRYPLLLDPGATSPVFTTVKGERYGARLVERVALIPLRAGKLSTGPMSARFRGREIGARVEKTSNDVIITVEEPPVEGRPEGFVAGDVGQFGLSATVAPRQVSQGGTVSVTVKIEGTGNIPPAVRLPEHPGLTWLAPLRKDAVTTKGGKIAGSRTLEYLARVQDAGDLDLGSITLPYFDPTTKQYAVAKAELGRVKVDARADAAGDTPNAAPGEAQKDPLASLPGPRTVLAPYAPAVAREVPLVAFIAGLVIPPLLGAGMIAFAFMRRRSNERRATSGADLRDKMKSAWKEAAKADKANDPRTVCAAIERAVHAALEAKTGLKTRAYRMDELPPIVEGAGVEPALAKEAKEVLAQCESLRFMPSVDESSFEGLRARAQALTKKLAA